MASAQTRAERRNRILVVLDSGSSDYEGIADEIGLSVNITRDIMLEMEADGLIVRARSNRKLCWRRTRPDAAAGPLKQNEAGFRSCLCCRNDFWSANAGNRRCPSCDAIVVRHGSAGIFDTPVVFSHR